MPSKPSEILFDSIKTNAGHPKSVTAMINVKEACDYLDDKKIVITPAEVARITKSRKGGPIDRSLRNNKKLMDYVRTRQAEQKLPSIGANGSPVQVRTGDPDADAYIYQLEVSNRTLKNDIKCLRGLLSNSGITFEPDASIDQSKLVLSTLPPGTLPQTPKQALDRKLVTTLAKLIDPNHFEFFGLLLDSGSIISPERNDRVFLDKSEVEAIQTALQSCKGTASTIDVG
jgi:hypothetical protein